MGRRHWCRRADDEGQYAQAPVQLQLGPNDFDVQSRRLRFELEEVRLRGVALFHAASHGLDQRAEGVAICLVGVQQPPGPERLDIEARRLQRDVRVGTAKGCHRNLAVAAGHGLSEAALACQFERLTDHGEDIVEQRRGTAEILHADIEDRIGQPARQTRGVCLARHQALRRGPEWGRFPGLRQRLTER